MSFKVPIRSLWNRWFGPVISAVQLDTIGLMPKPQNALQVEPEPRPRPALRLIQGGRDDTPALGQPQTPRALTPTQRVIH
jgi:hypothetical protein